MTKKTLCVTIAAFYVLGFAAASPQDQPDAEKKANEAVRTLAHTIESCPSADEVAAFRGKWVKVSWGTPQDVQFKVEKTATSPTPYKGTITFSIPYSNGQLQETKQDAEQDKDLRLVFVSPVRYVLRVSADSTVKLESKEIENTSAGTWGVYEPSRPERFCWLTAVR